MLGVDHLQRRRSVECIPLYPTAGYDNAIAGIIAADLAVIAIIQPGWRGGRAQAGLLALEKDLDRAQPSAGGLGDNARPLCRVIHRRREGLAIELRAGLHGKADILRARRSGCHRRAADIGEMLKVKGDHGDRYRSRVAKQGIGMAVLLEALAEQPILLADLLIIGRDPQVGGHADIVAIDLAHGLGDRIGTGDGFGHRVLADRVAGLIGHRELGAIGQDLDIGPTDRLNRGCARPDWRACVDRLAIAAKAASGQGQGRQACGQQD